MGLLDDVFNAYNQLPEWLRLIIMFITLIAGVWVLDSTLALLGLCPAIDISQPLIAVPNASQVVVTRTLDTKLAAQYVRAQLPDCSACYSAPRSLACTNSSLQTLELPNTNGTGRVNYTGTCLGIMASQNLIIADNIVKDWCRTAAGSTAQGDLIQAAGGWADVFMGKVPQQATAGSADAVPMYSEYTSYPHDTLWVYKQGNSTCYVQYNSWWGTLAAQPDKTLVMDTAANIEKDSQQWCSTGFRITDPRLVIGISMFILCMQFTLSMYKTVYWQKK